MALDKTYFKIVLEIHILIKYMKKIPCHLGIHVRKFATNHADPLFGISF